MPIVSYSPIGDKIAIALPYGKIQIWSTKTGKLINTFGTSKINKKDIKLIYKKSYIRIDDLKYSSKNEYIPIVASYIKDLKYSVNGKYIAVSYVNYLQISPALAHNNNEVVDYGEIKVWDTETGEVKQVIYYQNTNKFTKIKFVKDKFLISVDSKFYRIWDLDKEKKILEHKIDFNNMIIFGHKNNAVFASKDKNNIKITNVITKKTQKILGHKESIESMVFLPNDKEIMAISKKDDNHPSILKKWNYKQNDFFKYVRGDYMSLDGKYIILNKNFKNNSEIIVKDSDTNTVTQKLMLDSFVYKIEFSPNKQDIAIGKSDGKVKLWNFKKGNNIWEIRGCDNGEVRSLKYSPNGNFIALGCLDNILRIIDVKQKKVVSKIILPKNDFDIMTLKYSKTGKYLAVKPHEGVLSIWNMQDKKIVPISRKKLKYFSFHFAFSPNTEDMIFNDINNSKVVKIDLATGLEKELFTRMSKDYIQNIIYSPNGEKVAFMYYPNKLIILDIKSQERIPVTLKVKPQEMLYSNSGEYLAIFGVNKCQVLTTSNYDTLFTLKFKKNAYNLKSFSYDNILVVNDTNKIYTINIEKIKNKFSDITFIKNKIQEINKQVLKDSK